MKFRNFKKKLKRNQEIMAHYRNGDALTWFESRKGKGYFLIVGVDYEGEAWDSNISCRDVKNYIKEYKFKGFSY